METTFETHEYSSHVDQCIQDCIGCFQSCTRCLTHCMELGGKHTEAQHLKLMFECAQMCNLSAELMMMKASSALEHGQLCANSCEACADSCEEIAEDDRMMLECAEACRRCAQTCRNMGH